MGRRWPWRTAAVAAGLAVVLGASLLTYRKMMVDPVDYRSYARALMPVIQPGDIVFVHRVWYATPLLYHLPIDRYNLMGGDFEEATLRDHAKRVWVVMLHDKELTPRMAYALAGYRAVRTVISPPYGKAVLYEPGGAVPAVQGSL